MEKNAKEVEEKEIKAEIIEEKQEEKESTKKEKSQEVSKEKQEVKEEVVEEEKKEEIVGNKEEVTHEKEEENAEEKPQKKSHKWLIGITIVLIAIAILSTGFALININSTKFVSGVTIDKLNMKGLNIEQAREIINKKVEQKLKEEIKIKIDDEEQTMLLEQIELQYDVENAINEAYNVGRDSNIFVNNFKILQSKIFGANIEIKKDYNEELLDSIITDIKSKIPNGVQEVDFCIEEDKLIITKGKPGLTIDAEKLKNLIKENMNLGISSQIQLKTTNGEPKEINIEEIYEKVHTEAQDAYYTKNPFQIFAEVKGIDFDIDEAKEILKEDKEEYVIPLTITNPKKTINDIGTEAFPDLLSTFSTRYDESNYSRSVNLKLATKKINEVVVMPGEVFSYNKTLGKRTSEAGYREAAGYAGGKVVQMIGGGICQISSTLYDAVVYANLDIVERHNHAFKTSYVGVGKDATVVYGSLDFKFKNTRNYPIKIKATAQNGIARIDIYGIKEDQEYEIEISSSVISSLPYSVIYEDDYNLEEGVEKVTQNGSNGCKTITYKILRQNGAEVSRTVLSTDTYDPMNKYISRGLKKADQVEEPTVPTAVIEQPVVPAITETPAEPQTPIVPVQPENPEEPKNPENQNNDEAA